MVQKNLQNFLYSYKLSYYNVEIRTKDGVEVLNLNTMPQKCGPVDDKKGYCINYPTSGGSIVAWTCGVGWIYITDKAETTDCNGDWGTYACCEYDPENFIQLMQEPKNTGKNRALPTMLCSDDPSDWCNSPVQPCGEKGQGLCNQVAVCNEASVSIPLAESDCRQYDPVSCCVPKDPSIMVQLGLAASAEIPLFFRDKIGYLSVTVGNV
jgi:hypothetical protein